MKNRILLRLLAFAAFVLVFPFFLRRRHRVVRRAILRGTPAEIFPLINDLRNWPRWTTWNRREEIHYTYEGSPSGIGAVQKWSSRRMDGTIHIVQSVPDERIAYTLDIADGKYHMDGVIVVEPVRKHLTRVTWVAGWHGNPNPYERYVDLLMRWWIGRDFEAGLENLRELAESPAPVQPPV